ncbi:MAG: hypothetical protein KGK35_04100 [Xanthomonadaceae bacterium]|nr:hypothetical protein [Xanthomonadaceae bacterium]
MPETVRKGVGVGGQLGKVEWQINAGVVDAIYGAPFDERGADNSSAGEGGTIEVRAGDQTGFAVRAGAKCSWSPRSRQRSIER